MEIDQRQPVLYAEAGASWWPVLWGPVFALIAIGLEWMTGAVSALAWSTTGLVLMLATALWVHGRQRLFAVRLTPITLHQGPEALQVRDIALVEDIEPRAGAKVLGGGWAAPRGTTEVPIKLTDGSVVLGWARDADALRQALHRLLAS